MRSIDADAMIAEYGDWYTEEGTEEGYIGTIKGIVDSMPTIEPERKKGKWKLNKDGSGTCSECHMTQVAVWDWDNWQNFCGHCGADMRGE